MVFPLMKEGRGVWRVEVMEHSQGRKAGDAMNGSRQSRLSSDWVAVPGACVMCMNLVRSESGAFVGVGRSGDPAM